MDSITITLTDLHQAVGETASRVHYGGIPIVVTKRDKPFLLMVPVIGVLNEHTNILDLVKRALGEVEEGETGEEAEASDG